MEGLQNLNQIYQEIKDDIASFVNLYGLAKAAGMNVQHVMRLIAIANDYLLSVEYRYETRKREVDDLEAEKRNATMLFQDLNNQIITMVKHWTHIA